MDSARNVVVEPDETQGGGGRFGAPKGAGAGAGAGADAGATAYANPGAGAGTHPGGYNAYANPGAYAGPGVGAWAGPGVGVNTGVRPSAISTILRDPIWLLSFILRVIAIVFTFIAAVVMGETNDYDVDALNTMSYSAYCYFVAANVIVMVYSGVAVGLSILHRIHSMDIIILVLMVGDVVMLAFLFSGNGSAAATTTLIIGGNYAKSGYGNTKYETAGSYGSYGGSYGTSGYRSGGSDYGYGYSSGTSGYGKQTICDAFTVFCACIYASIVLSMFAAFAYLAIIILAIITSRRSSKQSA